MLFHFSFCQILFFIEVSGASPILNYSSIKLHKHWCNQLISSAFTLIEFVYMGILPLILMIPRTGCSVNSPLVFEYYFNGLMCLVGLLVACLVTTCDRTVIDKWNKITFNSRPFWYVGSVFPKFSCLFYFKE